MPDDLSGGPGDDIIFALEDADVIAGGDGDDRIFGDDGADSIRGQVGDDVMEGGAGADLIRGSFGDDRLDGSEGGDELRGGADADTFVLSTYDGSTDDLPDFRLAQGDQVSIDLSPVLTNTDDVRTDLVRAVSAGRQLQIQLDSDFSAANGFDPVTVMTLSGAGGRTLAAVLDNDLA